MDLKSSKNSEFMTLITAFFMLSNSARLMAGVG